jgi:hypothetical protein
VTDVVLIRLPKASVELADDDGRELIRRVHAARGKFAADSFVIDAASGALTHEQMIDVWNVIHDWLADPDADLGTVERLRDALINELPEIGQHQL